MGDGKVLTFDKFNFLGMQISIKKEFIEKFHCLMGLISIEDFSNDVD